MMNIVGESAGAMRGIMFSDDNEVTEQHETIQFQVRKAKDCVELHIVYATTRKGQRASSRYMLHSYTPAAYEALCSVLGLARIGGAL